MVKHKMLPFPDANVGEVLGLVEIIYAYGCKVKISFLAEELRMEMGELGDVVDMAELIHLVKVKNGSAELTIYGEALNLGTMDNKKDILRKQLSKIEPFKNTLTLLKKRKELSKAEILESLRSQKLIIEDEARFHKLLLAWGGYAELFEYDGNRQTFRLPVARGHADTVRTVESVAAVSRNSGGSGNTGNSGN